VCGLVLVVLNCYHAVSLWYGLIYFKLPMRNLQVCQKVRNNYKNKLYVKITAVHHFVGLVRFTFIAVFR
jgi:hypothetical protein